MKSFLGLPLSKTKCESSKTVCHSQTDSNVVAIEAIKKGFKKLQTNKLVKLQTLTRHHSSPDVGC